MRSFSLFLQLAVFSGIALSQDSTCYYANGTALREPTDIAPCNIDPVRTICCALNRTNDAGGDLADGNTKDECLPNGLCQNRAVDNGNNVTTWWLDFCANKDVTSSDCLDICRETRNEGGGTRVTPCDNTKNSTRWCCGDSSTCCTNNINVIELPQQFVGHAISSSVSSSAPSATGSSTPTPSQSAQADSGGLSTGAKAGIGVGAAAGALALLAAAFFARKAYKYKKEARGPKTGEPDHTSSAPYSGAYAPGAEPVAPPEKYRSSGYAPSELPSTATAPPSELPAGTAASPTELPTVTSPVQAHR